MLRRVSWKGRPAFVCEECGLIFQEQDTTAQCQAWCATHPSCNLEIGRRAIGSIGEG